MRKAIKARKQQAGLSAGVLIGCGITVAISTIGAAILSTLVIKGILSDQVISYITPLILFISSISGAYVSGRAVEKDKTLSCIGASAAFLFILFSVTILLFGGKFQYVVPGVLAIALGCGCAVGLNLRQPKRNYHKRR